LFSFLLVLEVVGTFQCSMLDLQGTVQVMREPSIISILLLLIN
jgi:hypothetical protein